MIDYQTLQQVSQDRFDGYMRDAQAARLARAARAHEGRERQSGRKHRFAFADGLSFLVGAGHRIAHHGP